MKLNLKGGIFRIVIVSFSVVVLVYEIATEDLLKGYFSWNNGFIFGLKIIIIPAALIYIIWWAITWCIKGFKEPKLNINWAEGANRLVIFLCALGYTSLFILMWVTEDLVSAILFTVILIVPLTILGLGAYWIEKGLKKSKNDKHHDEYDE